MWVETAAISHRAALPSLNPPPHPSLSSLHSFICSEREREIQKKRERKRERERERELCLQTLYPQTAAPISGIWVIFSVTHLFSSFAEEGGGKRREEKAVGEKLYEGLRD